MPRTGRWTRACERLVPEPYRRDVFAPCLSDLEYARASQRVGGPRFAISILLTALECRRLAARDRRYRGLTLSAHESRWLVWFRDLRQAFRTWRRQPMFAVAVIAILALGIGANVAVFSYVNALLLAPLPVTDPSRVVRAYGHASERGFDVVSYPDYRDLRDGARTLDLAAHAQSSARVGAPDSRQSARLELVTGNFFHLLDVQTPLGRPIDERDDEGEGAHPVVVLSDAWWRVHYAADRSVLGRPIVINGTTFEIVGVARAGFSGTYRAYGVDLWVPLSMQQQARPRGQTLAARGWGWLSMIGRLRPGTDLASAQRDLDGIADAITKATLAKTPRAYLLAPASSLPEGDRESARQILLLATALTLVIFFVTCANLTGLMQARLLSRRREFAIRHALGAGRWRLLSGWLSESFVLAVAGGAAGLIVGRAAVALLSRVKAPAELVGDLAVDVPFDWRVISFALGLSMLTAAIFALLPGFSVGRRPSAGLLSDSSPNATGGRRAVFGRRAAVALQVAASSLLLVTSGLLVRGIQNLGAIDPGFDTTNVALLSIDARPLRRDPAALHAFVSDALDRVRKLPGVTTADIAATAPLTFNQDREGFRIPGYATPEGKTSVSIDRNIVGAEFFRTLNIAFVEGRTWDASGPPSAVINETMARKFWPGRSPVGTAIDHLREGPLIISGVVKDIANYGLSDPPVPFIYLPAEHASESSFGMFVRTVTPVELALTSIERVVSAVHPQVMVDDVTTFAALRQVPLFPARALATLAASFGMIALVLSAVGLYGVVSASVGQRVREIGVRIALGATSTGVLRSVLREAMVLAIVGLVAGATAAYFATGALRAWLFGVGAFDATVYLAVSVLLCAIALGAAWMPARRAARIDPVKALRA